MSIVLWFVTSKAGQAVGMVGLLLAAVAAIFLKGRSSGAESVERRQRKEIRKAKETWDAIDRKPVGLDPALERLRERARSRRVS